MYCKYCGKQIDDDSVYCRYCGKKVGENKHVAETKPAADENLDYEVINEKTENSDFHIRFKDENCVYFKYINDKSVAVVAPDYNHCFDGCGFPTWSNYLSPKGHLNIPNFVRNNKKYLVTKIGFFAFRDCSGLQSIIISDSVTKIDWGSFEGCSSLRSIVIPDSVTVIGDYAFSGCSGLQSITIPNSVTEICWYVFYGCSSLQSIVIPNSVTEIGNYALSKCSSLQSIAVDKNNPKYDSRNDCNAIIETASNKLVASCMNTVIPDSVTGIGRTAFWGCSSLQNIVIPDSVTEIGEDAFCGCNSLLRIVVDEKNSKYDSRDNCNAVIETSNNILIVGCVNTIIPDSVTKIGSYAFSMHNNLQNIVIPDTITRIGNNAFSDCIRLQSIIIPDSVIEIGKQAFHRCSSLRSIAIPKSVTMIGDDAFYDCSGLQSIKIKNQKLLEGTGVDLGKVKIYD